MKLFDDINWLVIFCVVPVIGAVGATLYYIMEAIHWVRRRLI
jgi:hypothetical protein